MKTDILREKFLIFFKKKNHKIFKSDSLIPSEDPSVLFTPAGMNQFKRQFLGQITDFRRAATCQKCLRTDDLEKVGKTAYHHTFFEMLGNFSFGDYFKKEAILWAWEFLIEELKLKEKDLWVSVYKDDEEAYSVWKERIGLSGERILRFGEKENFWPANAIKEGPNGPCGPCSEIFFDRGSDIGCKRKECLPGCECGRFVEIWNLVFTQFNRKDEGVLEPLPNKNIDTGMGLERMASVLQGKDSNFQIDIFSPIVETVKSLISYQLINLSTYQLIYTISDHIRAICFAISDGVIPSNEGRGYVIRKIIRKSFLHGKSLGTKQSFLYKIAPRVSEVMGSVYPELKENVEGIKKIIFKEEEDFISTLDMAPKLFRKEFSFPEGKKGKIEGLGHIAFRLYDTYGIPLELTQAWLEERGFSIIEDEFEYDMNIQREKSKKVRGIFELGGISIEGKTLFLGYRNFQTETKILKIIKGNSLFDSAYEDEDAVLVLDKTVFYGEAGGQVGDRGEIVQSSKYKVQSLFEVIDTKRQDKIILHLGKVKKGKFKVGDKVLAKIDKSRRKAIARAHTSTHLLQSVLRNLFGEHIRQSGSLVEPDRLRFDFTHPKILTLEELERIAERVNSFVLENLPVDSKVKDLLEAKSEGAIALFGEKYEKRVRVVSIGDISKELCGGTHLNSTGEIGLFRIMNESSISKGVRRIEAICGRKAFENLKEESLKYEKEKKIWEGEKQSFKREISRLNRDLNRERIKSKFPIFKERARRIEEVWVVSEDLADTIEPTFENLRMAVDLVRDSFSREDAIILFSLKSKDKVNLICGVTKGLKGKIRADNIVRRIAGILGGWGGGREDLAEGGGRNISKLKQALDSISDIVKDEINKIVK